SMVLATTWALGHAVVVFVLGLAAIVLSARLPRSFDPVMERVVGATLVLLGVWVTVSLARYGRDFRLRSRWMLLAAAARGIARRVAARRPAPASTATAPFVVIHDHGHAHAHAGLHDHRHLHRPPLAHGQPYDGATAGLSRTAVLTGHRHVHEHVGSLPGDPFPPYRRRAAFALGALHGVGAETPSQVLVLLAAAH